MYQECLSNDIQDKLGARHGQLLALLAGEKGKGCKNRNFAQVIKVWTLKFGEEVQMDDNFALWNYTRALHIFNKHGDEKRATKLLNLAIERNPFIPPLLLHWKSCFQTNVIVFTPIGGEVGAFNYVIENWKYWSMAAEFLEKVFCFHGKVNIPLISKEARKLLSECNFVFESIAIKNIKPSCNDSG